MFDEDLEVSLTDLLRVCKVAASLRDNIEAMGTLNRYEAMTERRRQIASRDVLEALARLRETLATDRTARAVEMLEG